MGGVNLGVIVLFGVLLLIALTILLEHIETIVKMRAQTSQQQGEALGRQLEELAQQVAQIRQMHTDYVLNMDSHLQHLEYKLSALEQRLEKVESQQQTLHR
ncbi:MAG: hypothetical protein RMM06_01380 [Armatimonadota bacterium]|nr:hypothetical protein [bacterium]MCS7310717.1 hypothetical protein [Armatimonadota bacterium]MDW8289347.1 hypothetical protein [Armatimonadota bacterium]